MEWVLVHCISSYTVCLKDEDNTSPSPDPEHSEPSAMPTAGHKPEPTADLEHKPATKIKPEQLPEAMFVPEAEPESVFEPATASVTEGTLVEFVSMDWSPAHTPIAEVREMSWAHNELKLDELVRWSHQAPSHLCLCWFSPALSHLCCH